MRMAQREKNYSIPQRCSVVYMHNHSVNRRSDTLTVVDFTFLRTNRIVICFYLWCMHCTEHNDPYEVQ